MKYKEIIPVVNEILSQYSFALTIRQIYYRLISDPYNLFSNTRSMYNSLDRMLVRAREVDEIDGNRIEDRTRQTIGGDQGWESPDSYLDKVLEYIKSCWQEYSREVWASQQFKLEVWIEKDALASVISETTHPFRVLVFPSRGYSSYTKIKEALDRLKYYRDKQIIILHLADHDPSGFDMTKDLINRFEKYGGDSIEIKRIGLNYDQVEKFNLRPNPVKIADPRALSYIGHYGEECWELDALPPNELQSIVEKEIKNYIDQKAWDAKLEEIEKEREEVRDRIDEITERF